MNITRIIFFQAIVVCASLVLAAQANAEDQAFNQQAFNQWLKQIQAEAITNGVSIEFATKAAQNIQFLPEVISQDHAQPEFITPFLDYYHRRVTPQKVAFGKEKLSQYQDFLAILAQQYGVPSAYLISFWGMETHYGKNKGQLDVLSSLATLAYEGRRAEFFKQQLMHALKIAEQNPALLESWRGSWAGAFGHMQFMPSTFVAYATDGDGDGVIDLMQSEKDAFRSAANYLSTVGWQKNQLVMIEMMLPANFTMEDAQLSVKKTVATWSSMGVTVLKSKKINVEKTRVFQKKRRPQTETFFEEAFVSDGTQSLAEAGVDPQLSASILLPQGAKGPAFMVFDNFSVIMDWNRSINYALTVAQLAQRLQDQQPILAGDDAESGALSFVQMQQLQTMLNSLGFDAGAPDGLPGLKTQAAIRSFQRTQNLPADGYASPSLYELLKIKTSVAVQ